MRHVFLDFEFQGGSDTGTWPWVVCLVVIEAGHVSRYFREELLTMTKPPFDIGPGTCVVSYSNAEASCFLALGWKMPQHSIDLYAEYILQTNDLRKKYKGDRTMLRAMRRYGLTAMSDGYKHGVRDLILGKRDYTPEEREVILRYCQRDVEALIALFRAMASAGHIDWNNALWRGAAMWAFASIEHEGIPVDADLYRRIRRHLKQLRLMLIEAVDVDFGVFENGVRKHKKLAAYIQSRRYDWPRLASGRYDLTEETWVAQSRRHPELRPLHELKVMLDQLRTCDLTVGPDNRNRFWTRPLLSRTGRCQPSTSKNVMALARWARGLVLAEPGLAIVVLDYVAQEFAIAAGLFNDPAMIAAYLAGDVHMQTAIAIGIAPPGATEDTHRAARKQGKAVNFATNYGGGAHGLAIKLDIPLAKAKALLEAHAQAYHVFCRGRDRAVFKAIMTDQITAPMGWRLRLNGGAINPRSLMNFPMQAAGAEMLRAAIARMTLAGLRICATGHDSVMLLVPVERLDQDVALARRIMERTSLSFTNGLRVRTDERIILPGQRLLKPNTDPLWELLLTLLAKIEAAEADDHTPISRVA